MNSAKYVQMLSVTSNEVKSNEEYKTNRDVLMKQFIKNGHMFYYVPNERRRIERILVGVFLKSGYMPSKVQWPVMVNGEKWMRLYKFRSKYVLVEGKGKIAEISFGRGIGKWIKYSVMKDALRGVDIIARYVSACLTLEQIQFISKVWNGWFDSTYGTFGKYMESSYERMFERLCEVNKSHKCRISSKKSQYTYI
jgi:hypothetical protein